MAINWLEIGVQTAILVLMLAAVAVYARVRAVPRLKADAAQWMGAAIGRFMMKLAEQAEDEEGGGGSATGGMIELGGFKVDVKTVQAILGIVKTLQSMGFLKAEGGEIGGENPFV